MNNKQQFFHIGEQDDDLQTIKKTENDDLVFQSNQFTEKSSLFGSKLNNSQQLWQQFYKQELIQYKKNNPQLNHNELTSLISKKWKSKKSNLKTINKLKKKIKLESISALANLKNNIQQIAIFNEQIQKDEIAEKLKTLTFKLIYLDNICELKGETILEAIKGNFQLIYINNSNDISKYDNFDQDECIMTNKNKKHKEQKKNDENDINIEIENKIMNYL